MIGIGISLNRLLGGAKSLIPSTWFLSSGIWNQAGLWVDSVDWNL